MTDTKDDIANNPGQTIIARKLKNILESHWDNDLETQEALHALSTFFTENTLKNRRNLRGEIERQSLKNHKEFAQKFKDVKDCVDDLFDQVQGVNLACSHMRTMLDGIRARSDSLISQTSALQNRSMVLDRQANMVNSFLERYQLKPDEISQLTGSGSTSTSGSQFEISEYFFKALERSQAIQKDCRNTLLPSAETSALEVMDQANKFQDIGLQRVYRWATSQSRSFDATLSGSELSNLLSRALQHLLIDRPALFKMVIEEYCSSRRASLARSFIDALTTGGPGGTLRPIEWHAHDPQRYVGDMMAWLHQATPSECENINALLKACPQNHQDFDKDQTCEEVLSSVTEGVCRPLRNRVEQILLSEHGAVILYRLTNLIRFYGKTIKQLISSSKSTLVETLDDLDQLAFNQFMKVLQATVQQQTTWTSIGSKSDSPAHDLSPTQSTMALLSLLRDILSSTSVLDEQPQQLLEIVDAVVAPLINSLSVTAGSFSTTDQDVYLLNSLYQIHSTLALFKGNDARLAMLNREMQLHLDTFSSEQTSNLIANLGLQPVCTMIASNRGTVPLSEVPGMSPESLHQFLDKFDNFLVAPEVFLLPQTRLLASSAHRKSVAKRSLQVVSASYQQLYDEINLESNGYPPNFMTKTPQQVDGLLQL